MNAPAGASPARKQRRPRLQFSLRLLLVAFTACAIGIPIWYRWPFTEEKVQYQMVAGQPDKSKPPISKTVTTWRRTWGGGKLQHGTRTRELFGGLEIIEHYENDVLAGPYTESYEGAILTEGQYALGRKTGEWIKRSQKGEFVARTTWKEGRLDGPAELSQSSGRVIQLRFGEGVLAEIDGRPAAKSWAGLATPIESDSPRMATCFRNVTQMEFVETPLKDALQFVCDMHNTPAGRLRIDRARVEVDRPITLQLSEISLLAALAVLTESHGMRCEYHFGCVWVTSRDDGMAWANPTGIESIQPAAGTLLAAAWSEPVTINTNHATSTTQPLAQILQSLASQAAVDIDSKQVEPSPDQPQNYPTELHLEKLPFHQALGVLLFETGCRCELEGEKVIVIPREKAALPEK